MIYNPEILVYNVLEIKNMQKRRKQREGRGQMMDIKLPTVKTHVSHILTKLGGGEAAEARRKPRQRSLGWCQSTYSLTENALLARADSMT